MLAGVVLTVTSRLYSFPQYLWWSVDWSPVELSKDTDRRFTKALRESTTGKGVTVN